MEFKSAHISNFKLLQDLAVDFSQERTRPLTVIRAENASGKTSLLTALQWALYGNAGLDDSNVPLTASHWPSGTPCEVSVELAFSHTAFSVVGGATVPKTRDYWLKRTTTETLTNGRPQRGGDVVALQESTTSGAEEVKHPEMLLGQILSPDLKDVFFTNGDKAMSFISPQLGRADKRSQVSNAIKALLEIGVIEDAIDHVRSAAARKRKESGTLAGGDIAALSDQVNSLESTISEAEARKKDVAAAVADLVARYERADQALQDALQRGNYDELANSLRKASENEAGVRRMLAELGRQHQSLFSDEALSWSLMDPILRKAAEALHALHDAGVIPKTAIPVLKDRLAYQVCICGASLAPGTAARKAVEAEIERQRDSDTIQQRITRLFYSADADLAERQAGKMSWEVELDSLISNRVEIEKTRRELSTQLQELKNRVAAIERRDIDEKRQQRNAVESALAQRRDELTRLEMNISTWQNQLNDAKRLYQQALARDRKLQRVQAEYTAAGDILDVLDGVMGDLQGDYLQRVSARMDSLFRNMIAADADLPPEMKVITGASITPDFDIVVHAGQGRTLNPDHEVNGAAQRALTFAFIWALTEVSDTIAPRVIDTPLGMMSGYVKRSVLDQISRPIEADEMGRQVVLLLTRSEIAQVEDLIDERAGLVFTLTNTASGDLVNRYPTEHPKIVRCECNHRQVCSVCARQDDALYKLVARSGG